MIVEIEVGAVNLIDYEGNILDVARPVGVETLKERPSFALERRGRKARCYIAGSLTDNVMITEQRVMLRQFIAPVIEELVEDATPASGKIGLEQVAGTGPTGSTILYLRWLDPLHNRRSGFSRGSPTLALSGSESVVFRGVPVRPTPDDVGVTKIEVWVSVNGGSRRLLATRDTGATEFTITETIEYQTETVTRLQRAPRCKFNAFYHDRLYQAGDPQHPDRIYYSPPGRGSEYAGNYFTTRNGESVTGLCTIRDVVAVFCAHSSYYISGYSESDLQMQVLEPSIGAITHHGIKMVHDVAIVPSHQGFYECTGTAMRFLSGDYATLWCELYTDSPLNFEQGYAVVDERAKVYKFFEEDITLTAGVPTYGNGRFWVLDYKDFSQQEGGAGRAPYLSFDDHAARPKCSTMVAAPGGKAGNCYTAFTGITSEGESANQIVTDNNWEGLDVVGPYDAIIHPAVVGYEPDGGPNDGIKALSGWILVSYVDRGAWVLELMHGPERAVIRNGLSWALNAMFGIPQAAAGRLVEPGWSNWPAADPTFSPAALPFKMGLDGECVSIRLTVTDPIGLVWSGWGMTFEAGKKFLAAEA